MASRSPPRLVDALQLIKGQKPYQELAREAGVSPNTLQSVLMGEYGQRGGDKLTTKFKQGSAEALTRLALYVADCGHPDITPEIAVEEFGLDAMDPTVSAAIRRVQARQGAQKGISDAVLNNIANRVQPNAARRAQLDRAIKGCVRIGVLRWPPFVHADVQTEAIGASWAFRYCRRLVGALNPVDWELLPPTEPPSIREACDSLSGGNESNDLVFGVYDTPYRRLTGLEYLNLPGLGIPLGCLYVGAESAGWKEAMQWSHILEGRTPGGDQPLVIVLEEEVGHLQIAGTYQYPDDKVFVHKIFDPDNIAELLVDQPLDTGTIAFVADLTTCKRVLAALKRIWMREQSQSRGLRAKEFIESDTINKLANGNTAPIFRLGIAIRADAERWKTLLLMSQVEELFRNSAALTAKYYIDLLNDQENFNNIRLISLEATLPRLIALEFASLCLVDLWSRWRGPGELVGGEIPEGVPKTLEYKLQESIIDKWMNGDRYWKSHNGSGNKTQKDAES